MNKKIMLSVVALASILLVAGFGAAHMMGRFGFFEGKKLSADELKAKQDFNSKVKTAIQNNDYVTWKSLMETQLTQDNFNQVVAQYQKMQTMKQTPMNDADNDDAAK